MQEFDVLHQVNPFGQVVAGPGVQVHGVPLGTHVLLHMKEPIAQTVPPPVPQGLPLGTHELELGHQKPPGHAVPPPPDTVSGSQAMGLGPGWQCGAVVGWHHRPPPLSQDCRVVPVEPPPPLAAQPFGQPSDPQVQPFGHDE